MNLAEAREAFAVLVLARGLRDWTVRSDTGPVRLILDRYRTFLGERLVDQFSFAGQDADDALLRARHWLESRPSDFFERLP